MERLLECATWGVCCGGLYLVVRSFATEYLTVRPEPTPATQPRHEDQAKDEESTTEPGAGAKLSYRSRCCALVNTVLAQCYFSSLRRSSTASEAFIICALGVLYTFAALAALTFSAKEKTLQPEEQWWASRLLLTSLMVKAATAAFVIWQAICAILAILFIPVAVMGMLAMIPAAIAEGPNSSAANGPNAAITKLSDTLDSAGESYDTPFSTALISASASLPEGWFEIIYCVSILADLLCWSATPEASGATIMPPAGDHDLEAKVFLAAGYDVVKQEYLAPCVRALRELLAAKNVNVNARDSPMGLSALAHAARSGDEEAVWALIEAAADVNAANLYGVTPLHMAIHNDKPRIAALLIACGATPTPPRSAAALAKEPVRGLIRAAAEGKSHPLLQEYTERVRKFVAKANAATWQKRMADLIHRFPDIPEAKIKAALLDSNGHGGKAALILESL